MKWVNLEGSIDGASKNYQEFWGRKPHANCSITNITEVSGFRWARCPPVVSAIVYTEIVWDLWCIKNLWDDMEKTSETALSFLFLDDEGTLKFNIGSWCILLIPVGIWYTLVCKPLSVQICNAFTLSFICFSVVDTSRLIDQFSNPWLIQILTCRKWFHLSSLVCTIVFAGVLDLRPGGGITI